MNEQELEDKIWDIVPPAEVGTGIHKTGIWNAVGGHKKTCFDKIEEMHKRGDLKKLGLEGTKMMFGRIDAANKAQFEYGFTFQVNMLENARSILKGLKKKPFNEKMGKRLFNLKNQKPRTKIIKINLENMGFYYNGLLLFICRANLQRSLGLISKSVAEQRIEKCENALQTHFKELFSDHPRDSEAIKLWLSEQTFAIERFKI